MVGFHDSCDVLSIVVRLAEPALVWLPYCVSKTGARGVATLCAADGSSYRYVETLDVEKTVRGISSPHCPNHPYVAKDAFNALGETLETAFLIPAQVKPRAYHS